MKSKKKSHKERNKKNDRYEAFYQSLLKQHPELKRANRAEELKAIETFTKERDEDSKRKLRHRLEFLTDGIVAIIITIMVLEIPLPSEAAISYEMFLKAIGIFFLSFFLVAVFWYEHFKLFSQAEMVSQKVAIANLIFLAVLALIPILTKWMMFDVNQLSVMNYGAAYLIINIVKTTMFAVVRSEHINDKNWNGPHLKFIIAQFLMLFALNALLLYLAWLQPSVALMLYVILPLSSFFLQMFFTRGR